MASMIEVSTDTTGAVASGTERVAVLNFSIEKSGAIRCGSPSMRTAMPYRASIMATCSRFWFMR